MIITPEETFSKAGAAYAQGKPNQEHLNQSESNSVDVAAYLDHYGKSFEVKQNNGSGTIYSLKNCPFDPSHVKESSIIQQPDGMLLFQCFHNSCAGYRWKEAREIISGNDSLKPFMPGSPETSTEDTAPGKTAKLEWTTDPIPFDDFSLVPDFPIDAIPPGIGKEMIMAVSTTNQIDPAFTVSFYLAVLSLTAAGKFEINLGTHHETPNLYFAPSLPSGERKSATVENMTRPVYGFETALRDHARIPVAEDCNKRKIAEGRIAELQKKAAREPNPIESRLLEKEAAELIRQLSEVPTPVLPTFIADDITPEKLGDLMVENGEHMAILSSEGGIFDILAGRYDPTGSGNLDLYLKGYSGDPWRSHRIGRESKSMNRPILTVCLGIQPIVIEEILRNDKFRGRGLLARFLFSHGKPQAGYRERLTNGISDDLRKSYSAHIHRLLSADFPKDATILFTDEAQSEWNIFYSDIEKEMRQDGKLYPLKDFGSKLPGSVARIAGLLHFAEFGQDAINHRVSVSIVSASCVFGIFFLEHAAAIFGAAGEDKRIKVAKQILDSISRHKWTNFKGRDILRNTSLGNMEEAATGLKILIERGFIRLGAPMEKGPGRPESTGYEVNPKLKL